MDWPIHETRFGGYRNIFGYNLELAAEVVNLDRSVLITGDHQNFHSTKQGIHTGTFGNNDQESIFDIRYARVEYCGQRDVTGRYCLHFHIASHCENCILKVVLNQNKKPINKI